MWMTARDPLFFNKVAGAVLGTLLFMMGLNIFAEALFAPPRTFAPGYELAGAEAAPKEAAAAPAAPAQPLPVLLAKADPARGQATAKVCTSCHSFEKDGPNKIGPDLWGVVNRPIGAHEGFKYSAGMTEYAGSAKTWSFEHLNSFISNPKGTVKGTAMSYAGLKEDDKRADVLAYLATLADTPVELPKP
jgi:cytochrome c